MLGTHYEMPSLLWCGGHSGPHTMYTACTVAMSLCNITATGDSSRDGHLPQTKQSQSFLGVFKLAQRKALRVVEGTLDVMLGGS